MPIVAIVMGAGWVVFWIYWLAMSLGAKAGQNRWARFAGVRVAVIVIVLLLVRLRGFSKNTSTSVTHDHWLIGIGLALWVLGLGLAVWARVYLGRNWGMPMSTKEDPELVTTGPYHVVRHPIYSGIILAFVGTALAISLYWLIAVVLIGGYFLYSATVEERNMTKLFPDTYPRYRESTKMLIPYLL
jgi:protein-S-isoprenylcysteine O-methyltransferase Ste14